MLVFVGTSHRLPEGPERLAAILDRLAVKLGGPPKFIAVEGKQANAEYAIASEDDLTQALVTNCGFPTEIAHRLARLPHYEGRVSLERSGSVPVIWLTEGNEIETTSDDYVAEFQQLLHNLAPTGCASAADILMIHSDAELWALSTRIDPERERDMEQRLKTAAESYLQNKSDYGVIVIGACHLRTESGTLYDLFDSFDRRRIWCSRNWEWDFERWIKSSNL